jgi:hypothetical protein
MKLCTRFLQIKHRLLVQGKKTVVTNITVCNFSLTVDRNYYIRVIPNSETSSNKNAVVENKLILRTDMHFLPMKIMLESGDELQVKLDGSAVVAISAFGFEIL